MRRGLVPTAKEITSTRREIKQIQTTARKIKRQVQLFAK